MSGDYISVDNKHFVDFFNLTITIGVKIFVLESSDASTSKSHDHMMILSRSVHSGNILMSLIHVQVHIHLRLGFRGTITLNTRLSLQGRNFLYSSSMSLPPWHRWITLMSMIPITHPSILIVNRHKIGNIRVDMNCPPKIRQKAWLLQMIVLCHLLDRFVE